MADETEIIPIVTSDIGPWVGRVVDRLRELLVGQTVTHEELLASLEYDPREKPDRRYYEIVKAAREELRPEGMFFHSVVGEGYTRVDHAGEAARGTTVLRGVRRKVRRTDAELAHVDPMALSPGERTRFDLTRTSLALTQAVASPRKAAQLVANDDMSALRAAAKRLKS